MEIFWGCPPRRRSLLWWTLALICDLRPPLSCQRPRRRETPPPPSSRSIRSSPVRRGRTVRLRSCGVLVVKLLPVRELKSSHCFRTGRSFPPCSLSHSAAQPCPGTIGHERGFPAKIANILYRENVGNRDI